MRVREDLGLLDPQAGQRLDVEEPPVGELLGGRPPVGEPVVLLAEQRVERVRVAVQRDDLGVERAGHGRLAWRPARPAGPAGSPCPGAAPATATGSVRLACGSSGEVPGQRGQRGRAAPGRPGPPGRCARPATRPLSRLSRVRGDSGTSWSW